MLYIALATPHAFVRFNGDVLLYNIEQPVKSKTHGICAWKLMDFIMEANNTGRKDKRCEQMVYIIGNCHGAFDVGLYAKYIGNPCVSDCNFPGYKYSGWFDEDCLSKD